MAWKDTLLDASFKGVPFDVVDDTLRGSHALAAHEYPFVQGADIEDTGVSAMDMALTAVLWGDDYEGRLKILLDVLRETGAGELIHPIYGSVPDCVVADFEVAHNEESPDYCTVRMTFKQSVKAAPFFDRDLPVALADEVDFLADVAAWQGFEVFQTALSKIQKVQSRWNAFHGTVLIAVGVLYGQVNGVFTGSLNLLDSPRVLMAELQSVFGALANMHNVGKSGLDGWRDMVGGVSKAAATPWHVSRGTESSAAAVDLIQRAKPEDVAALTALTATVGACALAEQAADILAVQLDDPTLTPVEISRLLADSRAALQRALAAQRILAMMLADEVKADQLAYCLLRLYQTPADSTDDVYRRIEDAGLLPKTPYLETAAALAESLRDTAHKLQKQAFSVINLRPPLVQKTVTRDTGLHLLAFEWYGDYSRFAELLRLNPHIRHPNFIAKGEVLNAYAR
ncbi:DNA circularization protein [Neisseria dumasiana]|uniref:DNA circulation N-terminal domain-containing protein n=1 Tax=Neisseria dumasiana TaxID=1931275 RepID=A0A1X3DLH3_9NEIS|nr:DNA circularization N-terminal domain-containing protein [Neisseria dumasiana]OSI25058.1 hypothetical protein BV912_01390 [Neisseria dumasiana]